MNKIESKPTPRIQKGDTFVQMFPHPLVFMEVNEVEESTESMDFCIVTWYMINEDGLDVQRRFSMVAREGKFSNFEPISYKLLKDAKHLLRLYDADFKQLEVKTDAKSLYNKYIDKLIELLPDAENRLAIARQDKKKIITNKWIDCEEDNYWVEEDSELGSMYVTLVCVNTESYDDKNDKTISQQSIYLHDNCPYGWGTLVKNGAKCMVIEKPKNSIELCNDSGTNR